MHQDLLQIFVQALTAEERADAVAQQWAQYLPAHPQDVQRHVQHWQRLLQRHGLHGYGFEQALADAGCPEGGPESWLRPIAWQGDGWQDWMAQSGWAPFLQKTWDAMPEQAPAPILATPMPDWPQEQYQYLHAPNHCAMLWPWLQAVQEGLGEVWAQYGHPPVGGWLEYARRELGYSSAQLYAHLRNQWARLSPDADAAAIDAEFHQALSQANFYRAQMRQYPVWARVMATQSRHILLLAEHICQRFQADRPLLEAAGWIGAEDRWEMARAGYSDPHHQGATTAMLLFGGKPRLVYKPRPLALEQAYEAMLRELKRIWPECPLQACPALDRGTYGWMPFLEARPPHFEQELGTYYRRLGALNAACYFLGATDMHPSNLIPQGAWPVPIDWECLLSPLDHDEAGPVEDTCLFTGLSPSWKMDLKRTQGYYSYGLAEGPRAWVAPLPRFVWEDAGRSIRLRTVEVKGFDRRQVWMLRHPHQHLDSFLAGFQECFRWAMRHGVTRWLPLIQQAFGGLAPRYVARPTQAYRDTLFQMLAPAGLKDGLAYGVAAEQAITHLPHFLRGSARYPAMRHYEKRTLFEQDIPIFGGQTDGTLLLDGQGNALGPLLPRPPLAQLAARLQRADEAGMAWQTSCLSAFYASIGISRQERRMVPVSPEQLCRHLADAAMRLRVHPRQGHTGWLEWVPVHPNSTVLHPALAPSSLYDGSDGNALFLLWAGVWMHRPDWRAAGNDGLAYGADAASALLERAKAGEAILSPCAFTGPVLSSVYAHLLAAQWLPEAETRLWQLAGALREAGPEAFGAYPHDYVGGMASGLLLLARLLERARVGTAPWPLGWLERWIGEWRQALWEQIAAVEGPLPGMAHGQAGWLWALWESARVLGEGAAESDREALQDLAGKVADAAARQDGAKPSHAWWCAGLPGMALVLARLAQAGAPLGAAALQALRALEQLPDAKGDHLCCGEAGRWLAWQEASAVLGQTAYPRAGHLLRRFSRKGQWQYQRYAEGSIAPGALTGTPGIGIALLQMLFPQKNPCIFMLDSPPIAK